MFPSDAEHRFEACRLSFLHSVKLDPAMLAVHDDAAVEMKQRAAALEIADCVLDVRHAFLQVGIAGARLGRSGYRRARGERSRNRKRIGQKIRPFRERAKSKGIAGRSALGNREELHFNSLPKGNDHFLCASPATPTLVQQESSNRVAHEGIRRRSK